MPASILAKCPCGRTLRAREEHIGATVRCWDCGGQVPVPRPSDGARLAGPMLGAIRDVFRAPAFVLTAAGGAALTLALFVPWAGPWVALALAAWGVVCYGGLVRAAGQGTPADVPTVAPGRVARVGRVALGAAWPAVLVAPVLVRNGWDVLPASGPTTLARVLTALAFAGWVVMPVVLFAVYAHDRRGPVSPRQALDALRRHPFATLAAILVAPLGLVAIEACLVLAFWHFDELPLAVSDLFPTPELVTRHNDEYLVYQYDLVRIERRFSENSVNIFPVYLSGLRRGFTLLGSVPASLPSGMFVRFPPGIFRASSEAYLTLRAALAVFIFTGVGVLLSVQARWLGLIASRGARRSVRPALATAGVGVPVAAQVPVPVLVSTAGAARPRAESVAAPAGTRPTAAATSWNGAPDAATPAAVRPEPAAALPVPQGPGASRPRVLVIEDETRVAEALARILVARGYGVVLAGDAEEGLRQARSARPDVIVLDLLLPSKSGTEVCRELRADPVTSAIPILIATAADSESDELAGLAVGADDYIAKPYSIDVLIARIQKQLQRRKV